MGIPKQETYQAWRLEVRQGFNHSEALLTFTSPNGGTFIWDATKWPISMQNLTQRQVLDELMSALLVFLERSE